MKIKQYCGTNVKPFDIFLVDNKEIFIVGTDGSEVPPMWRLNITGITVPLPHASENLRDAKGNCAGYCDDSDMHYLTDNAVKLGNLRDIMNHIVISIQRGTLLDE